MRSRLHPSELQLYFRFVLCFRCCFNTSSFHMRVMNYNWSARKQHLHLPSAVDKPPFSFVKGHDSTMCLDLVWVSTQGHRSVSACRHFLLQALQCPFSVRKCEAVDTFTLSDFIMSLFCAKMWSHWHIHVVGLYNVHFLCENVKPLTHSHCQTLYATLMSMKPPINLCTANILASPHYQYFPYRTLPLVWCALCWDCSWSAHCTTLM